MTIKFDNLVADFYTVETMFHMMTVPRRMMLYPEFYCRMPSDDNYPRNIELNRLWLELKEWRETEHPKMARTLRDACLGMAIGESRHATEFDRYRGTYEIEDTQGILSANNSRQSVYSKLHKFSIEDASTLVELFRTEWCDSFGGDRWAEIAHYVTRYDELDPTTFIDVVVHAVHNGGCAFDKGLLVMVSNTSIVQQMLDAKFSGSILDLDYLSLHHRVLAWLNRYIAIMGGLAFDGIRKPYEIHMHDDHYFDQIEWSNVRAITLNDNPNRGENYCYDCESSCCDCNDQDDYSYAPPSFSMPNTILDPPSAYSQTHKAKQEKAKKLKTEFDFKMGKVCEPLIIR